MRDYVRQNHHNGRCIQRGGWLAGPRALNRTTLLVWLVLPWLELLYDKIARREQRIPRLETRADPAGGGLTLGADRGGTLQ
jgi:hypothetical protein